MFFFFALRLRINFLILAGEIVVQFKFTVMVLPSGPSKITGLPFDESLFESEHSISDPDLKVMKLLFI